MATLIRHRRPATDSWQRLDRDPGRWARPGEDGFVPDFPRAADLIVPLALWRLRRDDLLDRAGRVGVRLDPDDDPAAIADGRGFSTAGLLRGRYGYRGELRAVGDVARDQLAYLERCGFDAFALRDGENVETALAAFGEVSVAYQPALARAA